MDPPARPPIAVLDTNAFFDIVSCHDFTRKFAPARAAKGDDVLLDHEVAYRAVRDRGALLLVIDLDAMVKKTNQLSSRFYS